MCFKPSTIRCTRPWFFLAGMKIAIVTHCKYLGVIVTERNTCSDNDLECYLFKTYCSTMYCSALWFNSTKTA